MPAFTAVAAYLVAEIGGIALAAAVGSAGITLITSVVATGLAIATSRIINGSGQGESGAGGTTQNQGTRVQLPPATDNKIPVVYGTANTKGICIDARISDDNQTMTYVLALSEKTQTGNFSIGDVYWNDQLLTFGTSGSDFHIVKSSRDQNGLGNTSTSFADLIEMRIYAGTATSVASQIFPAISTGDTSAATTYIGETSSTYLLNNLVYAVVKLNYSAENGVTALAQMTFEVQNTLNNPGAVMYDYLTSAVYGANFASADIDTASMNTGSNSLFAWSETIPPDQFNSDGSTSTQKRYVINGVLSTGDPVKSNIGKIGLACAAWTTYDFGQGKWTTIPNRAVSTSSLLLFNDDNILDDVSISATNLEDLYNSIEVEFPNNEIRDQNDYYRASILASERNDLEPDNTLSMRVDLVNNSIHAQRLGLIELNQSRVDKTIQFKTDYSGLQVQAGDVIKVTNEVYGFDNKLFRVTRVREVENDDASLLAEITALEYLAEVYGDTTITQYQPNTASGIPSFGGPRSLPAPGVVVVGSTFPTNNNPYFEVSASVGSTSAPVDQILWYYRLTTSGDYTYVTNEVGPFNAGSSVGDTLVGLPAGGYYLYARAVKDGYYSDYSIDSIAGIPTNYIDWNPQPGGVNNGSISTSTFSNQVNIVTTSSGSAYIPMVSATSGYQPVYADADLTFSATPNTLGIAGIGAGINFVNTGTKITSPMVLTSPLMFQSNTTNGISYIGVQVNGSGATAGVSIFGQSDVFDSQTFRHGVTANTEVFFNSTRNGATKTLLPMNFYAGGGLAMAITTATRAVAMYGGTQASSSATGALIIPFGGIGVGGTIFQNGIHTIANNTAASSTNTGALQVVNGGVGIGGAMYVGGTITAPRATLTSLMTLTPQTAAPAGFTTGTFATADRVNWDPAAKGSGAAYPVFYNGTTWTALY